MTKDDEHQRKAGEPGRYSMSQMTAMTMLTEGEIRHFVTLGLITPLEGRNGRGVKRFSDSDAQLLLRARKLMSIGRLLPKEVVEFLQFFESEQGKNILFRLLLQLIEQKSEELWLELEQHLVSLIDFTENELVFLRCMFAPQDNLSIWDFAKERGFTQTQSTNCINQVHAKIGRWLLMTARLQTLPSSLAEDR